MGAPRQQEAQRQWEQAFRHASWGIAIGDVDDQTISQANPAFARMYGYEVDELVGMPIAAVFAPGVRAEVPGHIQIAHEKGYHTFESRHVRKDGSEFPVLIDVATVRDERGQPRFRIANVQDITERKRTEAALRESEERYRRIVETAHEGIWTLDAEARTTFVNHRMAAMLGYSVDEMLGRPLYDFMDDESRRIAERKFARRRRGHADEHDFRFLKRDGSDLWTHISTTPMFDERRRFVGVLGLMTDITEQRAIAERERQLLLEQAARAAAEEARQRAVFLAEVGELLGESLDYEETIERVAHLAVPRFADGCVVEVLDEQETSRERIAIAHVDPGKIELARRLRLEHPLGAEEPLGVARVLRTGEAEIFPDITDEMLFAAARTEERLQLLRALGLRSLIVVPMTIHGHTFGSILLALSESERRYTEDDLAMAWELARRAAVSVENARLYREAQRAIELRDEFVAIASHELRTPLTSLQLQLQSLNVALERSQPPPDDRVTSKLRTAIRQTGRLGRLIDGLLDVSRLMTGRLTLEREPFDLVEMVRDVVERLNEEARRAGCRLVVHAGGPVRGNWDRLRLEQVLTNLVSNALKYAPRTDVEITVGTDGPWATLAVYDRGIGIAPEDIARIFAPFERAVPRRHYGGLGLGLYIARQIVEAHGGTIDVAARPGEGSTFTVRVPAAG